MYYCIEKLRCRLKASKVETTQLLTFQNSMRCTSQKFL